MTRRTSGAVFAAVLALASCSDGEQAEKPKPFALTVWGWDRAASYGYPAGMGTKILNEVPAVR